jgi:hypothetical protein
MRRLVPWAVAAAVAAVAGVAVAGWRLVRPDREHYEEPPYTVEAIHPGFEVRAYAPTLQARVTLEGSRERATQQGFRILAGYIFGGNTARQSIDMTTPVSAEPASQSISMTTPVAAVPSGEGWTIAFTMPSEWELDTLPVPDDDRIELVEVPGHRAAVSTFSGRASARKVREEQERFEAALAAASMSGSGAVTLAQFDPPWVLGPWRRNELQIAL